MWQYYLTSEWLNPLKDRWLVLFPDAGSLDNWPQRAECLRACGFQVQVSEQIECLADITERTAGLDLADVLLSEWLGYPPSWESLE